MIVITYLIIGIILQIYEVDVTIKTFEETEVTNVLLKILLVVLLIITWPITIYKAIKYFMKGE